MKKEQISSEMQMVEVLEELLQSFERSYSELVEGSKQLIMGFFNTARDLEGTFHAQLVVVGQKLYDEKYNVEVWAHLAPGDCRTRLRGSPFQCHAVRLDPKGG